ncbi:ATP-binding protein [soil metagenome]
MGHRAPLEVFILAVLLAAWLGGIWPGLFTTALALGVGYSLFLPVENFTAVDLGLLCLFVLNAVLVTLVCESFHQSRHRAEQGELDLRESEKRHLAVLNGIPHLVWTSDERGELTYVNLKWSENLGLPIGETRNGAWASVVHEADLPAVVEAWKRSQESGTPLAIEMRLKMLDGQFRWHAVNVYPSKEGGGKVAEWFGSATDIDDSRHAADTLRESEERFRNLADSSPVLIWMSDTTKACTWFNKPWREFTGRTQDQEVGHGWTTGVHPDDYEDCMKIFNDNFDSRQTFERDYRLRRHDGQYRWIIDRGIPLFNSDGTFVGYMGGCIDIHERKENEDNKEALLRIEQTAREEAERTALLKDEFLATVSHEMRTPLTAMLGWVQLLRAGNLPSETIPQALETIERNARSQAKLIDDLLDMSRILAGRLRLDVQQVNVAEAAEAALAAAEPSAAAKKIRLVRVLDTKAGPVSGDPNRLQQVIWNLLSNSIKFTPSGGEVTVTLERVNSHIEISVQDTGEGISSEFLPHVFDRFRQQDATTMRKHQGLGLGLSIVKQLVELHGGSVRARSPGIDHGSTFVVSLPVVAAPLGPSYSQERAPTVPSTARREESLPSLLGVKVLIVDDDADARELLRSILAHQGASARTAGSVKEAMTQFENRVPDVLLSDIGMPGEDGYELIRKIRNFPREKGGQLPAVALTAFARSDDRRRVISAGFHMHLAKPVEPAELVTVVASLAKR